MRASDSAATSPAPRHGGDRATRPFRNVLVLAACMAIPFLLTLVVVDNNAAPRSIQTRSSRVPTMPELARMPMFWIFGIALFFSAHAMLGVQQNLISYLTGAHVSRKRPRIYCDCARVCRAGQTHQRPSGRPRQRRAGMIFSVVCVALGVLALLIPLRSPAWSIGSRSFSASATAGSSTPPPPSSSSTSEPTRWAKPSACSMYFFGLAPRAAANWPATCSMKRAAGRSLHGRSRARLHRPAASSRQRSPDSRRRRFRSPALSAT